MFFNWLFKRKEVSVQEFIEYLREYQKSKISRKDFFKTIGKIIVNEGNYFRLDKSELGFENYNFKEIDLSNMVLYMELQKFSPYEFNLESANLSKSNLSFAILSYANLSNTNLSNVSLHGGDLSNANLSNADLSNADLSNADLSNADLSNADLSNADLSNADLSSATIAGTKLSNTNETNYAPIKSLHINTKKINFKFAGVCPKLDVYHKKCLTKKNCCVVIFLQNGKTQIPLGVLKFLGNKSFLCIQNVSVDDKNYNRGFCYEIEEKLFDRIKQTTIENDKIYKCVVNELHLQVLRPINPKEISEFYPLMDSLLKDIENDMINFEEIDINQ